MLGISAANGAARFADAEELQLLISHARVRRGVQNAAAKLKEAAAREREQLWRCRWHCRACHDLARSTMMVWEEDVKVALSDFRSLNPGRLPILTPYCIVYRPLHGSTRASRELAPTSS